MPKGGVTRFDMLLILINNEHKHKWGNPICAYALQNCDQNLKP